MLIRQDGPTVMVWAPAKLNLYLKILGLRDDGFHEVVTVIAAIDHFDTLTLTASTAPEITLEAGWQTAWAHASATCGKATPDDALPPVEQNLVYKALCLLQQRSGCTRGAHVKLVKRIPPASGLGGGSSDAAAALTSANMAWGLGYSRDELMQIAAELGSDVPFFLQDWKGAGMVAICRGRGERVEPARAPAGLQFVVARPQSGLSTVDVYRRYKVSHASAAISRKQENQTDDAQPLLAALQAGRLREAAQRFVNDLQAPAAEISPAISHLAREFSALQPIVHQMSGSGSAYFGWFRHAAQARCAAGRLRHKGYPHVWHVQTI
jgi:4-diphosphocytidyl-2-C-methyl-D-erythritol kinase